jgi:hypothetical protein
LRRIVQRLVDKVQLKLTEGLYLRLREDAEVSRLRFFHRLNNVKLHLLTCMKRPFMTVTKRLEISRLAAHDVEVVAIIKRAHARRLASDYERINGEGIVTGESICQSATRSQTGEAVGVDLKRQSSCQLPRKSTILADEREKLAGNLLLVNHSAFS